MLIDLAGLGQLPVDHQIQQSALAAAQTGVSPGAALRQRPRPLTRDVCLIFLLPPLRKEVLPTSSRKNEEPPAPTGGFFK